jgi:hypothetical protein
MSGLHNTLKLPDELEQIISQLSVDIDAKYWKLADLVRDLVDELYPAYSKGEIRRGVALAARQASDTVRDLERMSRRVPEGKRRQYEALSRHQLRACLSAGDAWEVYAQWALESADDFGGRPAPVVAIRARVKGSGQELSLWLKRWGRIVELAGDILDERDAPEWMRGYCVQLVNAGEAG